MKLIITFTFLLASFFIINKIANLINNLNKINKKAYIKIYNIYINIQTIKDNIYNIYIILYENYLKFLILIFMFLNIIYISFLNIEIYNDTIINLEYINSFSFIIFLNKFKRLYCINNNKNILDNNEELILTSRKRNSINLENYIDNNFLDNDKHKLSKDNNKAEKYIKHQFNIEDDQNILNKNVFNPIISDINEDLNFNNLLLLPSFIIIFGKIRKIFKYIIKNFYSIISKFIIRKIIKLVLSVIIYKIFNIFELNEIIYILNLYFDDILNNYFPILSYDKGYFKTFNQCDKHNVLKFLKELFFKFSK
jgi:hypothetical protein